MLTSFGHGGDHTAPRIGRTLRETECEAADDQHHAPRQIVAPGSGDFFGS